MGLGRSAIFTSVGHQTSCDIYCSKNSSVLKSQLFINMSLSQVVASFQVQIQLVWNINPSPDLSHSTPERLFWTQICSLYRKNCWGNGFLQTIRSEAAQKRKHRKLMLGTTPKKSVITWCNNTKNREESRCPKWLVMEHGLIHYYCQNV